MFRRSQQFLGLIIFLLAFVLGWLALDYRDFLDTPLAVPEQGMRLTIAPGKSLKAVTRDLARRDMLERPRFFEWHARLRGLADQIKAGEYDVRPGMTPGQFLDMLVQGKVVQYAFTIVEGWNIHQLLEALAADPVLEHSLANQSPEALMSAINADKPHPEGWFLPDTYFFVRGTTDRAVLQRAHTAMQAYLDEAWPQRDNKLPYEDSYEALIMASIVEKETAVAAERGQIAGVFVRRLQKAMRLQTDPTVIYGIGKDYDGNIRRRDLRTDTPYNTYTRKGLPPTPIAMPGRAAIDAALHPAQGKSLYFVARGDGSHAFAETLDEHNRNVIKYQLNGRKRSFSSYPDNSNKKNGS